MAPVLSPNKGSLSFIAGTIPRLKFPMFERILFRALRGNLYMNSTEIKDEIIDPTTSEKILKNVFCIFCHGKEISLKIKKICESLGATLYSIDERPEKRNIDALEVDSRIADLNQVLQNTYTAQQVEFNKFKEMNDKWSSIIHHETLIYNTLNKFVGDDAKKSLIAEGWCTSDSIPQIKYALTGVTERTGSTIAPVFNPVPTTKEPPTHQDTNKFTNGFQEIVDAYGVATYREVNPGLFTCISFPFLFAGIYFLTKSHVWRRRSWVYNGLVWILDGL